MLRPDFLLHYRKKEYPLYPPSCDSCALNTGKVCAGYIYGTNIQEAIKMFPNGCDCWDMSLFAYEDMLDEVQATLDISDKIYGAVFSPDKNMFEIFDIPIKVHHSDCIEVEQECRISLRKSTSYLDEDILNQEFEINSPKRKITYFYSEDREKCALWLKKKQQEDVSPRNKKG